MDELLLARVRALGRGPPNRSVTRVWMKVELMVGQTETDWLVPVF